MQIRNNVLLVIPSRMSSVISLHDYATIERPEIEWLIPGLVPKTGNIVLAAPPKTGKTNLALQLAFAVCSGGAFLGKRANRGNVLYLYVDSDEDLFVDRIRDLIAAGLPIPTNLLIPKPELRPHPLNVLASRTQDWVRNAMRDADPDLVIVDVVRKLHSANEDNSTEMKNVADIFGELFHKTWAPDGARDPIVLYLHHTYKIRQDTKDGRNAGRPRASEAGRGSSFVAGDASANWLMLGGILSMESRFHEDLNYTYVKDKHGLLNFPETFKTLDLMDQLVKLCERYPEKTHAELAGTVRQLYELPQSTYYRYMKGVACVHVVSRRSRISGAIQRVPTTVDASTVDRLIGTSSAPQPPSCPSSNPEQTPDRSASGS